MRRRWAYATLGLTLAFEAITLAARFATGVAAQDLGPETFVLVRMHHMFWAVPLLRSRPNALGWVLSIAVALVASDLLHHFVALPVLVGGTGWHWP